VVVGKLVALLVILIAQTFKALFYKTNKFIMIPGEIRGNTDRKLKIVAGGTSQSHKSVLSI